MAMVRPIALKVNAFDATKQSTFTFSSTGGNQVVKNRLTIRLNSTNQIIYQQISENYKFEHIVPSDTLVNGEYYNFYFNTYDINGDISPDSNVVSFYCYTEPTLVLKNIPLSGIIENSSYEFTAEYNQREGELLSYCMFYLYDAGGNVISQSGELHKTDVPPFEISHTFSGFNDNSSYRIKVEGYTVNGAYITSATKVIYINYYKPAMYSTLQLENICKDGYIEIKNNITVIDGESYPYPPTYIEDNYVDLTENGAYVKWEDGFTIEGDFVVRASVYNVNYSTNDEFVFDRRPLIIMGNETNDKLYFTICKDENRYYAELFVYSGNLCYVIKSNVIEEAVNDYGILIKRINDVYSIEIGTESYIRDVVNRYVGINFNNPKYSVEQPTIQDEEDIWFKLGGMMV